MRLQRRRASSLNVSELEGRTLLAVTGAWLGQDGYDVVGLSPDGRPDDIQDLHFAITGLPAGRTVAAAVVNGFGGGQWVYNGPSWGPAPAAWVQAAGSTTADLFIDPYQVETGREFNISVTFD